MKVKLPKEGDYVLFAFKTARGTVRRAFGIVMDTYVPSDDTPPGISDGSFHYFSTMEKYWADKYGVQIRRGQAFVSIKHVGGGSDKEFAYPSQFIARVFKCRLGRKLTRQWLREELDPACRLPLWKYCLDRKAYCELKERHRQEMREIAAANEGRYEGW